MPLRLHLTLSDEAEEFIRSMSKKANVLTPQKVIERALWLLKTAEETSRVALLRDGWEIVPNHDQVVDRTIVAYIHGALQEDTPVSTLRLKGR